MRSLMTMERKLERLARDAMLRDDAPRALRWYDDARAWIQDLAADVGIPWNYVAGFVAALSPMVSWSSQLRYTSRMLDAALAGLPIPGPGFDTSKRAAMRIVRGEHPLSVLQGPKVRAFYRSLVGDEIAVTIDRHAFAAAHGGRPRVSLTEHQYWRTAEAYRRVALRLGLAPSAFQALIWVHWRALSGLED